MSAMLELDELEPVLGGNCMTPGVTAFWASPRFGHPHSHIPSVLGIPFSYYCSVLGVPRYPPGMPKSLAFFGHPLQNNLGFRGKIENLLEMDSLNIQICSGILKIRFIRKALQNRTKQFLENSPRSLSMTQN